MKTDLFSIGSLTVHGYGLMIGIGFILAMLLAEYRAKRLGLREEAIIDITIIAGVSGFLGAKLLYVIVEFDEFIKNPKAVLGSAGFVVYGGIIAGVLCCMLYCKVKKLNFMEYFDLVMPEIALAQGFGRIGCFLAGCCYGKKLSTPIVIGTIEFARIPVQIIESMAEFILFIVLFILSKKNRDIDLLRIYLVIYAVIRFADEFLRGDKIRGIYGGVSTAQWISLIILFVYGFEYIKGRYSKKVNSSF